MASADGVVKVEVLFFAKAREIVQKSSAELTLTSSTTPAQILAQVEANFPALKATGFIFEHFNL